MTFEGEHRAIPLRGIERAMANGVAEDGGMNEVINLIPRNGSYVPYAPTGVTSLYASYVTATTKMVRVHHTSTGDNGIVVYPNSYKIVHGTEVTEVTNKVVNDIVFIGNRMDLETSDGIEHWLWKNGEYVNTDDLDIHSGGSGVLPSVSFKVERGIYDGKTVYQSARYVRLHRHFTDADVRYYDADKMSDYVRDLGSMGGDALALLNSIRQAGGITGYVLVAAAWRIKGSDVSNPKYVMASPVMLMGSPEIYMKDDKYWAKANNSNIDKPGGSFLFDVESLEFNAAESDKAKLNQLWKTKESDTREIDELAENENVFIDLIDGNDGKLQYDRTYVRLDGAGQTDDAVIYTTDKSALLRQPALYGIKYAMYKYNSDSDAEFRGLRISYGTGNVLYFKLNDTLASDYKDEIDRLCIFVSPVVSPYKKSSESGIRYDSNYVGDKRDIVLPSRDTLPNTAKYDGFFFGQAIDSAASMRMTQSGCAGSFSAVMKSDEEIRNEIKDIAGLYKVSEIQLNELPANTSDWIKVNLSDGRLATDRMVQKSDTMLKISDLQPVGFTNGHIFGYNERLHVFNFQKNEVYRLPYESLAYYGGDGQYDYVDYSSSNEYAIEVTDSNDSLITCQFSSVKHLNPLVSCADMNTKRIRIARRYTAVATKFIGEEIHTNILEIGGLVGGYLKSDLKPIEVSVEYTPGGIGQTGAGSISVGGEVQESTQETGVSEDSYTNYFNDDDIKPDSYAWGKNEIRVSNPSSTIFEVDKSYKIGHGEIIALARLSMGLSQDNYSKFPLVVFCTDGIYTLSVDASGHYAYGGQDPLSRVVCTNKNGICELDGAVLFPTENGLMLVTTDGVKAVAVQAIGEPKNGPDATKGLGNYATAISTDALVQLSGRISTEDFLDYVQSENTYARYIHALNAVLLYNSTKAYSYILDLGSLSVTKSGQKFVLDDGDYPKQTFIDVIGYFFRYFYRFDYNSGDDNSMVLLQSRAIDLETTHLKGAYRLVLRGVFGYTRSTGEPSKYAGLYVFGSLDGETWDYVNGEERELTGNKFYDMGVETHHVSYRYLMVVFAGRLSKDSHIDGLEMTSSIRYNNKLK